MTAPSPIRRLRAALSGVVRGNGNNTRTTDTSSRRRMGGNTSTTTRPRTTASPLSASLWGGAPADVPMSRIVAYRQTDPLFSMACRMNTAYSVGQGMHNELAPDARDTPHTREALEILNMYCRYADQDALNQTIALDHWASGNAFLTPARIMPGTPPDDRPEHAPDTGNVAGYVPVPLSSITGIRTGEYGEPVSYTQYTPGHPIQEIPASEITHMAWQRDDGSPWGTGLGQLLAREGVGYVTNAGKTVRRPSLFEIREMYDDVAAKTAYAGVPRWSVSAADATDTQLADLTREIGSLDPLSSMVHGLDAKFDVLSLAPEGRMDSLFRRTDHSSIAALMSPLIQLWTSMSFTYASAKEAVDAMQPLVSIYRRYLAREIETRIYRTILQQSGYGDVADRWEIRVTWGAQETMTVEQVRQVHDVVKSPEYRGLYDPASIIRMLNDAGASLDPAPEEEEEDTTPTGGEDDPPPPEEEEMGEEDEGEPDDDTPLTT